MFRLKVTMLFGMTFLAGGCTHATFGFRPSLMSQVPDSTVVRARAQNGQPAIVGRAFGWQSGNPRIVTATGDTVDAPRTATLEVRLNEKKSHATLGGVVGLSIGFGIKLAKCAPMSDCPSDLTPALTAAAGALIGSRWRSFEWVRVRHAESRTE